MNEYEWVSQCVHGWVPKDGILSLSSLKWCQSVQKTFLYLYWHKDHTKLCPQKPARLEEKDDGHQPVWSKVKSETPGRSVGSETPKQGVRKLG